jgi:transcriptional regulator with XRE-family HTH domain
VILASSTKWSNLMEAMEFKEMVLDAEFIAAQSRELRRIRGWTQENLADAANLSVRTIEKMESGRYVPSETTLLQISRALGFEVGVFTKPTLGEEKRLKKEVGRSLRKVKLVPTSPIKNSNDFYSRNKEWHAYLLDASAVGSDAALKLAAEISDRIQELDGVWGLCSHSQRLEEAASIAALCRKLETLGYLTHLGSFRQAHMKQRELMFDVLFVAFLPKENNDGERFGLVTLEDPWEIPESDRPKF